MEVERVIADTPCSRAFVTGRRDLVSLAINAKIHDMISANGAVVHDDVPCPKSYSIPLFDFESRSVLLLLLSSWTRSGSCWCVYFHVGHDEKRVGCGGDEVTSDDHLALVRV